MLKQTIVIFALVAVACVVVSGFPGLDKGKGKYELNGIFCPMAGSESECSKCCEATNGKPAKFSTLKKQTVFAKIFGYPLAGCYCTERQYL